MHNYRINNLCILGGDLVEPIERIFLLLEESSMEQKEFAKQVGVAPSKVTEWKKGRAKSFIKYLPQIAEILNTNVQWLLTGEGEKDRTAVATNGNDRSVEFAKLFQELTPENQGLIIAAMRGLKPDK